MGAYRRRPLSTPKGAIRTIGDVFKQYLPTLPGLSREVLTVLVATVVASWVISQVPALQQLVRQNTPPSPI